MMKYLLFLIIILAPLPLIALDAARFDWSWGNPAIVDDTSTTCNNQATVRYDWVWGEPVQVFDTTATCTAAAGGTPVTPRVIVNGPLIIQGQVRIP